MEGSQQKPFIIQLDIGGSGTVDVIAEIMLLFDRINLQRRKQNPADVFLMNRELRIYLKDESKKVVKTEKDE